MAKVVAANTLSVLAGKKGTKPYAWASEANSGPCLSSFGPTNAVGELHMPGCFGGMEDAAARKFKAKDFFMGDMGPNFGMGKTW